MLVALLLNFCALQSSADFSYAEVISDQVEIRAFYDAKAVVVFTAAKGTPVKVVAEMYPWSKVQIPGGYDLWVYKSLTTLDSEIGIYHVNGSRTRSRSKPSTDADSHSLGVFPREADLVPLFIEEDWIKVRAPESMSAWVLSAEIKPTDANLDDVWQQHVMQRQAVSVVEVIIEEPILVDIDSIPHETVGAVPVEASSVAAPTLSSFGESEIAIDSESFFEIAIPQLEALGDQVVIDYQAYDFELVSLLETQLAYVLWHTSNGEHVESARSAIAKLDGMRSYYLSRINNQLIDTPLAQQGKLNPELRKLRNRAMFSRDTTEGAADIVVGWVEFKPRVQAAYPFEISRAKNNYLVQSVDSHYKLRDFVSRQVIMRGTWRSTQGAEGKPLFAISEMRIMPTSK
jgi:SH3-like domain-containing protein